jgi:hypothetical protein
MVNIKEKQLLCTFSNDLEYLDILNKIINHYNVCDGKIFIFSNCKNITEYYLTYNVSIVDLPTSKLENTISIHRKKMFNTLYTLNGMNILIKEENKGVFDKSYQLDWSLYKNSLILSNEFSSKIIELNLIKTIFL